MRSLHDATPVDLFAPYHVVQLLAKSGMSEVYRALAFDAFGRPLEVVIKQLKPSLERRPRFRAQFEHEARLAAQLCHPNLTRLHALHLLAAAPFFVLEYVDGLDLAAIRRAGRAPVPWRLVMQIGLEVARGLAYAHALADDRGRPLRLVHRDVSASNVIIASDGTVKLLDFGIAKALARPTALTRPGELKGKLSYMAPEQLAGEEIDERVDQYSLGVVLYELLTGRRLFPGRGRPLGDQLAERRQPVAPIWTHTDVPDWVAALLERLLQQDPRRRYAEIGEACQAIAARLGAAPRTQLALLAARPSRAGDDTIPMCVSVCGSARLTPTMEHG